MFKQILFRSFFVGVTAYGLVSPIVFILSYSYNNLLPFLGVYGSASLFYTGISGVYYGTKICKNKVDIINNNKFYK